MFEQYTLFVEKTFHKHILPFNLIFVLYLRFSFFYGLFFGEPILFNV